MQIPSNFSATAQAITSLSQISAREKDATQNSNQVTNTASIVDQSQSSSADRDAQGQGDGLPLDHPPKDAHKVKKDENKNTTDLPEDLPPGALDLVC